MNILVINSGSSSIKFQFINMNTDEVLAKGLLERIGIEGSVLNYYKGKEKKVITQPVKNHEQGIELIVSHLTHPVDGVIKDKSEIYAIGHRVVHGGERFSGTVIITQEVMDCLKECIPLAPLHNPPNIMGIEATQRILPGIPMAGIFDTAFHHTMPKQAYVYPIPYEYYEKNRIRRYGFHGTSHYYVAKQGAKAMNKPLSELKIITCHLGNGSSMTAIRHGQSVDTSMGFTPLEGLMMGTRCGDIDPAIPMFLQRNLDLGFEAIDGILNKQSGMKGISGVSSDMRDVEAQVTAGNERATLALDMFTYRIKKYIGAYIAAMNGVDLIIFTAGIGERDPWARKLVLKDMEFLGIEFDEKANEEAFGKFGVLTRPNSRITVMVIPTNEELEIAEETLSVVNKQSRG